MRVACVTLVLCVLCVLRALRVALRVFAALVDPGVGHEPRRFFDAF